MAHKSGLICGICNHVSFDPNDAHHHSLTAHASKEDKDFDPSNPEPPASFYSNRNFGPNISEFTPYNPEKINQLLKHRKMFPRRGGIPPPPQPTYGFFGDFRGIPGLNNSCWADVFFMIMSFSSAFDGIFTQEALDASVLLQIILYDLIIPLRTRMSVSRDVIAMIRQLMFEETRISSYVDGINDLAEFTMHLCNIVPFSSVCNFVNSSDALGSIVCPIVLELVSPDTGSHDCLETAIRYSLKSKETTIQDLPEAIFLGVRTDKFDVPPLVLPEQVVNLKTGTYLHDGNVGDNLEQGSYSLTAIPCIYMSHYYVFLKLSDGEWCIFDSMHRFDNGHCVPTITHVPGFKRYLESGCRAEYICSERYHRLVTDCSYAYFFSKSVQPVQDFCRIDCDAIASPLNVVLFEDLDQVHHELASFGFSKSVQHVDAFCRRLGHAIASPMRVRLPEIDDSLFEEDLDLVHHEPHSFRHTHSHHMSSKITNPERFYEECKYAISSGSFPIQTAVKTRFDGKYCDLYRQNLFSSIVFPEFPEFQVRYRIISFTMEDGTIVSYHGNIDNLSKQEEKQFFYDQLHHEISHQDVISVVIEKIH
jgi:hypothetical protein